ncbi:MAG: alpha-mannosidase, partial [Nocardioides sp.]|nr:alpha-mannosidase [Nocardioides sp.]
MHDRRSEIEGRLARIMDERLRPAVHTTLTPLTVEVWHVPPDPYGHVGEPVPFREACRAPYVPGQVGLRWGPAWGTTWFRLTGTVPTDAETPEAVVDLGWSTAQPGFQAEALVYDGDGRTVKGLHPRSSWLPATPGQRIEWYVEAAANPAILSGWQPTEEGDRLTASGEP